MHNHGINISEGAQGIHLARLNLLKNPEFEKGPFSSPVLGDFQPEKPKAQK